MMMMKSVLLSCVFTFSLIIGSAQNKRVDSLKHELAISKPDTSRVLVLVQLCNELKFTVLDSAFYYGQEAVTLARQIKFPKGEASALYYLAVTNLSFGDNSKALELAFKSFQIADKNDLIDGKQAALNELGNLHRESRQYPKALFYLQQARRLSDAKRQPGLMYLTLTNIANTYLVMNKLDSAEYYTQLAGDHIYRYQVNWARMGNLRTNGRIRYKKGEVQKALDFLHQSLIYAGGKPNLGRVRTNYELAKIYKETNQPDSAIYYGRNALDEAQEGRFYNLIVDASSLLAELHEPNDPQKTIGYNKITLAAQDSLSNFGKTIAFKSIAEFDEKERQYEIETAQAAYKNKVRQYALLAGVAVFLLIAFILYRNNKKQQQANDLLYQQKEAIGSALTQLKTTQSQLIQSEKMASLGELTAGIAHEIQNPLNFINNFSDVNVELLADMQHEIGKGNTDEINVIASNLLQNEQKINHHGKRADSIVKGMLQHSKTNAGRKEPTDINALADEYLRLSYHGLRAKDNGFSANFKTDFEDHLGTIKVVPQDIGRVLLNIYNNAFYSINEKKKQLNGHFEPTVFVSTRSVASNIEITVRDNGCGIPQKVLDKIYQPFFTTKPAGQGTGLGLSLSYDIITKGHGGEMKVETKEGEGAEFIITIPSINRNERSEPEVQH
jgi:two-component system, NtrC family, sensor kinase